MKIQKNAPVGGGKKARPLGCKCLYKTKKNEGKKNKERTRKKTGEGAAGHGKGKWPAGEVYRIWLRNQ